ncbi:MAG: hypothetical protein OHK0057_25120 [Thermoflexibacter sp.]
MKKITFVFLLIFATVLTSFAHEFWLALEKFILKVGEKAKISFLVGEDFTGEIWKGSASSFYDSFVKLGIEYKFTKFVKKISISLLWMLSL